MLTENDAKHYYEMGKAARKQYSRLGDAMWEMGIPQVWHAQKAFDMGYNGIAWDVREYQRLGNVPDGPSCNYMDQQPERGVSVMTDEWMHTVHGMFFVAKYGKRAKTTFRGVFVGHYGGDGEPLVLPVE